ncbi:helix-turn-helix domain-containing protein [Halocynthiibacter styelae]|uniref:Helix-turn-helix transcriptional regulator n=1 Tax=Halocynthiibacter styelae TaxID=2761955 RepID=A0A8J7IM68_9RHOB|nr:helix-turn-helix transcriptional regulator [Paenihalocynthiibacter styelae]MBI1493111.1 helix-turn-helix transcriptional regulator [Paenihalocynthiibacter styelae]
MQNKIDKRARALLFRQRLGEALKQTQLNRSSLALAVGVDRSTISQLLSGDGPRLPNAQVVAECASALGVSADWLLGLTDRHERTSDLLASSVQMTAAPRAMVDEQILAWHQEAAGYKICHVPATMPDVLKTREMLRWEYAPQLARTARQAIGAAEDRLNLMRQNLWDFEIAMPVDELTAFARAEGYYHGLPVEHRLNQIDHMLELHERFYPKLRIYLFDAKKLFSAPVTIFGPLQAVIYLGQSYLAFRDKERVESIRNHFDSLVRESEYDSRQLADRLKSLRDSIR